MERRRSLCRPPAVAYWLINLCAYWAAEIVVSGAYLHDEEPRVIAVAFAGYVALALLGWLAWQAFARTGEWAGTPRGWLDRAEPWVAFAPGTVLLAPKMRVAVAGVPLETFGLLLLAVGVAGLLARVQRHARPADTGMAWMTYAWLALAVWTLAVPVAGLGALLDRAATSASVLWGYNRAAALSCATAAAAWSMTLARGSFPRRAGARRLGHVALALTLAVLVVASRPTDPPIVAHTEAAAHAAPAASPPVILITMDTTRADHLSVYGYPRDTTPALTRLAREAVVHANAYSTSSWTLPAHASLFTGLMPSQHRADRLHDDAAGGATDRGPRTWPLDPDQLTLAEWLAGRGYRTGAVAANFAYLSHAFGLDQGFQFCESRPNSGTAFVLLDVIDRRLVVLPWLRRALLPYRPARVITPRALAWARTVQHVPFFLFVNYMEPHTPNVAGLRYAQFAGDDLGGQIAVAPASRTAVDLYDSEIASMDAAIGELLDGLRLLGVYDRSLIVVTADHGESFGERGTWGHGTSLNQPELRIPLIVKYPWSARRGRRRETASIVDVLPTIGREVRSAFPRPVDGEPLGARDGLVVAELRGSPSDARPRPGGHDVAVLDHQRKLIWTSDGSVRVYDLAADPGELRDVASLHRRWARDRMDRVRALHAPSSVARHADAKDAGDVGRCLAGTPCDSPAARPSVRHRHHQRARGGVRAGRRVVGRVDLTPIKRGGR